jgi:hypothetical protein
MNTQELLTWFEAQKQQSDILIVPSEIFGFINTTNSKAIISHFHSHTFMQLPESEIAFFQWLQSIAPEVWDDLWKTDAHDEPYIVSISLLTDILQHNRGFPICDLMTTDNYYFTSEHFIKGESDDFIQAIENKILSESPLSLSQLLAWEIYTAPIDIWRFSYIHNVPLRDAKKAVHELVEDRILIHLRTSAELSAYMEL